jgi:hypothetical protein
MTLDDALWDAATGVLADSYDYGRSNDGSEWPSTPSVDERVGAYCHNLSEAGYLDWRLPAVEELTAMCADLAGLEYLSLTDRLWSSSMTLSLYLGDCSLAALDGSVNQTLVRCVRGMRKAPSQLVVVSAPAVVGVGYPPARPIVVAVRDPDGKQVNSEGRQITVTTTLGALTGATSATTNRVGVATLDAFVHNTVGQARLTLASDGLAPATVELRVGPFKHNCLIDDDAFVTADGGCKQLATGLSWSFISPVKMQWQEAVWDSQNPPGNAPPDGNDHGRTEDYDGAGVDPLDQSIVNYCHSLVEGGFADWRLPALNELRDAYALGEGAATHFSFDTNKEFWSSTTLYTSQIHGFNLASGQTPEHLGFHLLHALCVRP